jgi:hypothetical protein
MQKRIAAAKILPRVAMHAQHLCRKIAATKPKFPRYLFSTPHAPPAYLKLYEYAQRDGARRQLTRIK